MAPNITNPSPSLKFLECGPVLWPKYGNAGLQSHQRKPLVFSYVAQPPSLFWNDSITFTASNSRSSAIGGKDESSRMKGRSNRAKTPCGCVEESTRQTDVRDSVRSWHLPGAAEESLVTLPVNRAGHYRVLRVSPDVVCGGNANDVVYHLATITRNLSSWLQERGGREGGETRRDCFPRLGLSK